MTQPQHEATRAPKVMSERLKTMKFMQRAAASSPVSQVLESGAPPAKRQRVSEGNYQDAPPSAPTKSTEEIKIYDAIERQAIEAGDTKWVLSTVNGQPASARDSGKDGLRIIMTGYSDIDQAQGYMSHGQARSNARSEGRRSFGGFNRRIQKHQQDSSSSSSSEAEDPNGYSESNKTPNKAIVAEGSRSEADAEALARAKRERRAQRKAAKAESVKLAERRKSKEVKLNRLSSISGGGGMGGRPGGRNENMECYKCGQMGHAQKNCPNRRTEKRKMGADDNSATKRHKTHLDY